jgi:hypothetical protein
MPHGRGRTARRDSYVVPAKDRSAVRLVREIRVPHSPLASGWRSFERWGWCTQRCAHEFSSRAYRSES